MMSSVNRVSCLPAFTICAIAAKALAWSGESRDLSGAYARAAEYLPWRVEGWLTHHHTYDVRFEKRMLPVLRAGKVDAFIAGHDHALAHLKPEAGVEFFVAGGGGAEAYDVIKENPSGSAALLQFRRYEDLGADHGTYVALNSGSASHRRT